MLRGVERLAVSVVSSEFRSHSSRPPSAERQPDRPPPAAPVPSTLRLTAASRLGRWPCSSRPRAGGRFAVSTVKAPRSPTPAPARCRQPVDAGPVDRDGWGTAARPLAPGRSSCRRAVRRRCLRDRQRDLRRRGRHAVVRRRRPPRRSLAPVAIPRMTASSTAEAAGGLTNRSACAHAPSRRRGSRGQRGVEVVPGSPLKSLACLASTVHGALVTGEHGTSAVTRDRQRRAGLQREVAQLDRAGADAWPCRGDATDRRHGREAGGRRQVGRAELLLPSLARPRRSP